MGLPPPVNLTEETDEDISANSDNPDTENVTDTPPEVVEPKSRGRGRPRSTGQPKRTAAKKASDAKSLGRQIAGIHKLAALATGFPELAIQDEEGERLAEAVQAVAEEYGLNFSGKTGAAMQLFAAAGMVYAPRAIAIKVRLDRQRKEMLNAPPSDTSNGNPGN